MPERKRVLAAPLTEISPAASAEKPSQPMWGPGEVIPCPTGAAVWKAAWSQRSIPAGPLPPDEGEDPSRTIPVEEKEDNSDDTENR